MAWSWSDIYPRKTYPYAGGTQCGEDTLPSWGKTAKVDNATVNGACGPQQWYSDGNLHGRGSAVSRIQRTLNARRNAIQLPTGVSFPGLLNVDGQYGTKTVEMAKFVQTFSNLSVDGYVGQNTWNLLKNYE
ncbi:MAG TPA: peptidoglycan-binding domain-containing protein [Propioniciclava sp.]|jgi:peptidoglycan hydrolase-like protein with peptidoglycan-binding domain|uniref:peptidoglycan-binding domain-containing protein n=1 Tax=Propioniciclava sp. TaxID=2038686 RepID=UPI002C139AB2|nr:peptidoglycan-binding domain-containing protein [Propioniciclava sp.]HRL48987.1 peptidoglycan-binding domain-containing protein [Propioniciclava sp.]HRL80750.1 peptidoglycan-binding domain-containing protein [Propioniciclava sp.]